jgi:hypothetical protein
VIVELIGCAGAGKTTVRRILCERGSRGSRLLALPDLVRDHPLLRRIEHPTLVNVVQEVAGLPYFLGSWRTERVFVALARELLAGGSVSTFDRLNGMRGIVRKLGMYQLARHRAEGKIVLSDEGTVLSAYNLLVMTNVAFDRLDVERFLAVVPLPDRIVYVRAPVATLVARAKSRPDRRRQHIGGRTAEIERDIRRTVELFELIATSTRVENRVLAVENDDADDAARRRVADEIAAWLEGSGSPLRVDKAADAVGAVDRA